MRIPVSLLATAATVAAVAAAAMVAACSGGATAPLTVLPVAGTWHFAATIADTFSAARTTCTLAGNMTLTQSTVTFTGAETATSRSCTGPAATTGAYDGPVIDGQAAHNAIAFRTTALPCIYGADSTAISTTSISGYITCELPRGSGLTGYSGTFALTK